MIDAITRDAHHMTVRSLVARLSLSLATVALALAYATFVAPADGVLDIREAVLSVSAIVVGAVSFLYSALVFMVARIVAAVRRRRGDLS